jgi:hypothetical protein
MTSCLNKLKEPKIAAVTAILLVMVLGVVNGLDFPLSVPYIVHNTGHNYLDMCAFCGPSEVQSELAALGERGRILPATLLSTIDVLIPLLSFIFGFSMLGVLGKSLQGALPRFLQALPWAALSLDFAENGFIIALLVGYPTPDRTVAGLEGIASGLKFAAYGGVLLSVFILGIIRLSKVHRQK